MDVSCNFSEEEDKTSGQLVTILEELLASQSLLTGIATVVTAGSFAASLQ